MEMDMFRWPTVAMMPYNIKHILYTEHEDDQDYLNY